MKAPDQALDRSVSPLVALATSLAAALATCWVFRGALDAAFLDWDDPLNITRNPAFRGFDADHLRWMFTTFTAGHFMPLTWLSLALDHELFGLDARAFHRTNVALHALNAVLVLALARTLFAARMPQLSAGLRELAALVAALAFSLHPLRAESVAWVTERRDVLSSALLFASLLVYLRGSLRVPGSPLSRRARIGSVLLYAASLLSKSMGITLPVVLVVIDLWTGRVRALGWGRIAREKLPYLALAVLAGGVSISAQSIGTEELASLDEFSPLRRVMLSCYGLAFYPWKTLWPTDLSPLYEIDRAAAASSPRFVISALVVLLVTGILLLLRKRRPALLAAWVVYAIVISPLLGLVQTGVQEVADRFSYLATVSFALLLGAGLAQLAARGRAFALGAGALAMGLLVASSVATPRQVAVWKTSEDLWSRALEIDPEARIPRLQLAILVHTRGDFDAALGHYDRLLAVLAQDPRTEATAARVDARYNRALSLLGLERIPEALDEFERALVLIPSHRPTLLALAKLEPPQGRLEPHLARWRRALDSQPSNAVLHLDHASVLLQAGRVDDARSELELALELDPDSAPVHYALGVLTLGGDPRRASELLARAVRLDPFQPSYWTRYGMALAKRGEPQAARAAWQRALAEDPNYAPARAQLEQAPDAG